MPIQAMDIDLPSDVDSIELPSDVDLPGDDLGGLDDVLDLPSDVDLPGDDLGGLGDDLDLPSDDEVVDVLEDFDVSDHHVTARIEPWLDGTIRDDVIEIFSPPRLVPHCARLGLRAQISIDIATGYNLLLSGTQRNVMVAMLMRFYGGIFFGVFACFLYRLQKEQNRNTCQI